LVGLRYHRFLALQTLLMSTLSTLVRVLVADFRVDGGRLNGLLLREKVNIEAVKDTSKNSGEIPLYYTFRYCRMKK